MLTNKQKEEIYIKACKMYGHLYDDSDAVIHESISLTEKAVIEDVFDEIDDLISENKTHIFILKNSIQIKGKTKSEKEHWQSLLDSCVLIISELQRLKNRLKSKIKNGGE